MKLDLEQDGLEIIFKPWQVPLMETLFIEKTTLTSRQAHDLLMKKGIKISRASVIYFLQGMVQEGWLDEEFDTGKGGYHSIFSSSFTARDFWVQVASQVINVLVHASEDPKLFAIVQDSGEKE